jgi:hypothetical protein
MNNGQQAERFSARQPAAAEVEKNREEEDEWMTRTDWRTSFPPPFIALRRSLRSVASCYCIMQLLCSSELAPSFSSSIHSQSHDTCECKHKHTNWKESCPLFKDFSTYLIIMINNFRFCLLRNFLKFIFTNFLYFRKMINLK